MLDCNESLLRILGYDSPQEFRRSAAGEIFYDPADRTGVALQRSLHDAHLGNHDVRLKRKGGAPVWVLENVSLTSRRAGAPRLH